MVGYMQSSLYQGPKGDTNNNNKEMPMVSVKMKHRHNPLGVSRGKAHFPEGIKHLTNGDGQTESENKQK